MTEDGRQQNGRGADISAFLARLRRILDEREMSQARLARALGVGEATVSEWFTRGRVPQGDVFLRLPAVLKINGHWLLTGNGPPRLEDHGGDGFRAGARAVLRELERYRAEAWQRYGVGAVGASGVHDGATRPQRAPEAGVIPEAHREEPDPRADGETQLD